jgi:aspartyl-tRNA(Asn)/glutamyl-tRNA(Gln) amidotransferase subunit C
MALSAEQVLHIAELVKLALSDEEVALYQQQLSEILEHFDRLNELNTDAIPPTAQVADQQNVYREDRVREWLATEEALANAPDAADGFFRVRPVLEG